MKRISTIVTLVVISIFAMAQTNQLVWSNGNLIYGTSVETIDSLTYGEMEEMDTLRLFLPQSVVKVRYDTLSVHDTVCIHDTISLRDTISILDTIFIPDTLTLQDTLMVRDTLTLRDTLSMIDTLIMRDTLTVRDTLTLRDTLTMIDTLTVRDTIYIEILTETANEVHEYVDLGLSVKWATCNVGANKPFEYGDYFAWGETKPKEKHTWESYLHCNGAHNNITKYNPLSNYGKDGFTDNKTVLDPEDDAATANWGGTWRMPTKEEQDELKQKCTWVLTTENGVKGYRITSNVEGYTDRSIFLPSAGLLFDNAYSYGGEYGSYWSSSLDENDPQNAYYYAFSPTYAIPYCNNRFVGQSVRAVCP